MTAEETVLCNLISVYAELKYGYYVEPESLNYDATLHEYKLTFRKLGFQPRDKRGIVLLPDEFRDSVDRRELTETVRHYIDDELGPHTEH
jgi:hypothetical protein